MKTNYRTLLTGVILTGLATSTLLADPSQAELMKRTTITKSQAEKIAMAKVPNAKIQSAEIENEHDALVWSFDMVKPGTHEITEVLVNAKTGKIVDVSIENNAAQAKEKAADMAAGQK